jgi:hypothetical protein
VRQVVYDNAGVDFLMGGFLIGTGKHWSLPIGFRGFKKQEFVTMRPVITRGPISR